MKVRSQPVHLRSGHWTSVAMEPLYFYALRLIALQHDTTMADLMRQIEVQPRPADSNLAAIMRCFVVKTLLAYYPTEPPPARKRRR
jgi:predicted DNA-binding ribbon-helix-helix protein